MVSTSVRRRIADGQIERLPIHHKAGNLDRAVARSRGSQRLLLPGQGLLDRQLAGWPCDPLLCGAGLRSAQLSVLVEDCAAALDGQLRLAFRRGARLLPRRGDYHQALAHGQHELSLCTSIQGPRHPGCRSHIACWVGRGGDAAAALRLVREFLPEEEQVLGPRYARTLATRRAITHLAGEDGGATPGS
jgi:hypothetical protein